MKQQTVWPRTWIIVPLMAILVMTGVPERGHLALTAARAAAGVATPVVMQRAVPPGAEPITPENASRVGRLARWGNGEVRLAAYSADGSILAVGTSVGVAIYDAATLTQQRLIETDSPVGSMDLSSDGSVIAVVVASSDLRTRLWRVADGMLLGKIDSQLQVALSPDGQYLAGDKGRNSLGVWRVADLSLVREIAWPGDAFLTSLAFSPDSQLLAAGGGSPNTHVMVWQVADGAPVRTLDGHTSFVRQMLFAPDGLSLATSSDDHTVRVWNLADGAVLRMLTIPDARGRLSPDFETLVASKVGEVTLQKARDGVPIATLASGKRRYLGAAAFSPDGRTFVTWTAPDDDVVRLWRVADGAAVGQLDDFSPDMGAGLLSPDGQMLTTSTGTTVPTRRLSDGALVSTLDVASVIRFSPDGQFMAEALYDDAAVSRSSRQITLRRLPDGSPIATFDAAAPVELSPDSSVVVTSSGVWRVADGTLVRTLDLPAGIPAPYSSNNLVGGCPMSAAISPDGSTLACGWADGALSLYRLADGAILSTWDGHRGPEIRGRVRGAESLAFSPDGTMLLSGAQDATAALWHLPDGARLGSIAPGLERVKPVAFTSDGRLALAGSQYGYLLLWPVPDGAAPAGKTIVLKGHTDPLAWIGVTADSRTIVTTSGDGTTVFWGVQ